MTENERPKSDFKQWAYKTTCDDLGDHGLIQSVDASRAGGDTLTMTIYEDGEGGLIVTLTADEGVKVTIEHQDAQVRHNPYSKRVHRCAQTGLVFE